MTEQSAPASGDLSRNDIEAALIAKAWKDETFAEELRRNPREVVQRELARLRPGAELEAGVEIEVLEETPTKMYLVVPAKPSGLTSETLTDADLEAVAGGVREGCGAPTTCIDPATWVRGCTISAGC